MENKIKVVFAGNFINHHQIPFCDSLYELTGGNFTFIETESIPEERRVMGWESARPKYVISFMTKEAESLINESDLFILGWVENTGPFMKRLKNGKPALRISERIYREGQWKFLSPKGLLNKIREHVVLGKYPVALLCNGAYVAADFRLIGAYRDKYRFGYFPPFRQYDDLQELWNKKGEVQPEYIEKNELLPMPMEYTTNIPVKILWAGRFIKLKHPELLVAAADNLVRKGYRIDITMVGEGETRSEIERQVRDSLIEDYFEFRDFCSPGEVRDMMEKNHIFVFSSDFLEGWGAVVNEAMNSGCAVIASREAGAVPFLIKNGKNGFDFNGTSEDLQEKLEILCNNPEKIKSFGKEAYFTIKNEWNGKIAAERVMDYYAAATNNKKPEYNSGPLSEAEIIWPGFFKTGKLE